MKTRANSYFGNDHSNYMFLQRDAKRKPNKERLRTTKKLRGDQSKALVLHISFGEMGKVNCALVDEEEKFGSSCLESDHSGAEDVVMAQKKLNSAKPFDLSENEIEA